MLGFDSESANPISCPPVNTDKNQKMTTKDAIREQAWTAIEQAGAAHTKKVHDRIPHFRSAEEAALRIFELDIWQNAQVIKGNPDRP